MDHSKTKRFAARARREMRVRKKVRGSSQIPRLSVSKTNQHIYAQLIDDVKGISLGGVGTLSKANQGTDFAKKSKAAARHIGQQVAEMAKGKNIEKVVFDRGRYKFHGLVAELAAGAREAGLQF